MAINRSDDNWIDGYAMQWNPLFQGGGQKHLAQDSRKEVDSEVGAQFVVDAHDLGSE